MQKRLDNRSEELSRIKKKQLSIESMSIIEKQTMIEDLTIEVNKLDDAVLKVKRTEVELNNKLLQLGAEIMDKKNELNTLNNTIDAQNWGLYEPQYNFASSLLYKDKLTEVRATQKQMIKDKTAVNFFDGWTVNGSAAEGKKMTNNNIKQILRSFNNECETIIMKVKYNNLDASKKRMETSYQQLNKMNENNQLSISPAYLEIKKQEMYLAYEYERKKQEEKEELKLQREKEREEKALQKEINAKMKIIDKDLTHYNNMISDLESKMKKNDDQAEIDALKQQIAELQEQIENKEEEKNELDYRNAHAYAGYVYIISNIGAFGEDVFKIGVTRRLEPLERINELSSASVPFKFDVHALIFSYDAFKLEAELHDYFHDYRINKVNNRKEFFRCSIDLIEQKLKEYETLTIDFTRYPEAEEYMQSRDSIQDNHSY
ncbi:MULTISPECIES: DUF4041 domain-containing protein [Enterococcaceae]|uniref:DUF4041 domain-containing protein n=1 Tax=Enterococcaceae TaxID=81852 RepID=UPI000E553436|nr:MULTISPECIES: DUF4041 domain-containing protein [Enterococcaceae]MCI0129696.1 DUF4041 domain-containing protein [Vagococcus sp. CY53-2]RGI31878.1 DUF4041 domain-containing protein [Melissococcus sp. OM08-11BH]